MYERRTFVMSGRYISPLHDISSGVIQVPFELCTSPATQELRSIGGSGLEFSSLWQAPPPPAYLLFMQHISHLSGAADFFNKLCWDAEDRKVLAEVSLVYCLLFCSVIPCCFRGYELAESVVLMLLFPSVGWFFDWKLFRLPTCMFASACIRRSEKVVGPATPALL